VFTVEKFEDMIFISTFRMHQKDARTDYIYNEESTYFVKKPLETKSHKLWISIL